MHYLQQGASARGYLCFRTRNYAGVQGVTEAIIISRQASVAVVGAGGHAKVVISTLQTAGYTVDAIFDDDRARWGEMVLGVPVQGDVSHLTEFRSRRAVVAVGDNSARRRIVERFPGTDWVTVVHPAAYVHPSVRLGGGCVVFGGVVVQPDVVIGDHVIINTGATVDHDCVIEDFSHLAPGVHLAGSVQVCQGAFLGVGTVVVPGVVVGQWSVVGAGAAVVRSLPPGVTAMGVPATPRFK